MTEILTHDRFREAQTQTAGAAQSAPPDDSDYAALQRLWQAWHAVNSIPPGRLAGMRFAAADGTEGTLAREMERMVSQMAWFVRGLNAETLALFRSEHAARVERRGRVRKLGEYEKEDEEEKAKERRA